MDLDSANGAFDAGAVQAPPMRVTTEAIQMIEHDPDADAIYVHLAEGLSDRIVYLDDLRLVDVDANGTAVGVEFLHISGGINLANVPHREIVEEMIAPFGFRVFT
jgi:uncharacterized protein YuzE